MTRANFLVLVAALGGTATHQLTSYNGRNYAGTRLTAMPQAKQVGGAADHYYCTLAWEQIP